MSSAHVLPVIVNQAGGTASSAGAALADRIESAFAAADQAIDLALVDGEGLLPALARHGQAPRIVVGGGDGTIGSAAHAIAARGAELAILPLGTRNHFARQLRVPLDLAGAARLAATGDAVAVDLGDAEGRTFVNNASAGAYVEIVRDRQRSSLPKLPASVLASVRVLRKLRPQRFTFELDGERCTVVTPQLFIGNNRYEIAEGHPGQRGRLCDGVLGVAAVAPLGPLSLLRLALRMLVGKPDMRRDFVLDREVREITIVSSDGGHASLGIALDGERHTVTLPLRITIRPLALRVVAPGD